MRESQKSASVKTDSCPDPPCLSEAEKAAAKAAGDEAEAYEVKVEDEAGKSTAELDAEHDAKVMKKVRKELEIIHGPHYGSNCLTLKAYAIASYDQLMDLRKGSVNVLKPILRMLAESPDANNTKEECEAMLAYALPTLSSDPDIGE